MSEEPDYEVGYGRPPAHTRFRKGRSGNPSGRPKGSKSLAEHLETEGRRMVTVQVRGKPVRMPRKQVAAIRIWSKALDGDPQALRTLVALPSKPDAADGADRKLTEAERKLLEVFAKASPEEKPE